MEKKLANPAPLGLTGFALTTWMLSMVNAGWFTEDSMPLVLASAFAYGGTAQFAAGLMEYPRGNTFGFVAFCSYGAFWIAFALFFTVLRGKDINFPYLGAWLVVWAVFTFFMWLATFKLGFVLNLVFLTLWIAFALLGASHLLNMDDLHTAGGYVGMVTAVLSFYLAAAQV